MKLKRCAAALSIMVIADGVFTWTWLRTGIALEGNPAVASLIDAFGLTWGLTLRTIGALILVAALVLITATGNRAAQWAKFGTVLLTIVYGALMLWHIIGGLVL